MVALVAIPNDFPKILYGQMIVAHFRFAIVFNIRKWKLVLCTFVHKCKMAMPVAIVNLHGVRHRRLIVFHRNPFQRSWLHLQYAYLEHEYKSFLVYFAHFARLGNTLFHYNLTVFHVCKRAMMKRFFYLCYSMQYIFAHVGRAQTQEFSSFRLQIICRNMLSYERSIVY